MKQSLVITDLTRMAGTRVCIAGYDSALRCVRPVFKRGGLEEFWLFIAGCVAIRPFAEIEFEMGDAIPQPPHCEDRIIQADYRVVGMRTPTEAHALLSQIDDGAVANIFGAEIHADNGYYVRAGEGQRSLGTITVAAITQVTYAAHDGRADYRLGFTDQAGASYRLAITDLAFRDYCEYQRVTKGQTASQIMAALHASFRQSVIFLRIGLARGWEKFPDRCFLQITGIFTFPDYLDGKCFADFREHDAIDTLPPR